MKTEQKIIEIENRIKNESLIIPAKSDYHESFHLKCAEYVKTKGLWLEFGVFTGRSIEQLSRKAPKEIFGFDSFEGLPEYWDKNNPKGCYGLGGKIPPGYIIGENHSMFSNNHPQNWKPWPENVKLIKGLFEDTLPKFLKENNENVAFVHIDGDLYSSAKTVFDHLRQRFQRGTIILFDELLDYDQYKEHEIKAFAEFLINSNFDFIPLLYQKSTYSQVLIELK